MTVALRKYSLPNCTLVLEGLGSPNEAMTAMDARPLMSVLTSVECHFMGNEPPLRGGLEFFQALVIEVSRYAQGFLSGIAAWQEPRSQTDLVTITTISPNCHRLVVRATDVSSANGQAPSDSSAARQIDLTTVQLFDLVEAVDQFLADDRTLPGLTVPLAPLSRRYLPDDGKTVERVAPAAIGIFGLALTAVALFYVPIPEVQRPKELSPATPGTESVQPTTSPPTASPSPGTPSPSGSGGNFLPSSPSPSPPQSAISPPATTATSPTTLATPPTNPSAGPQQPQTIDPAPLLTAPVIADEATLTSLRQQLQTKLTAAWTVPNNITQDLSYQVTVGKDGAIVGYKPIDEVSRNNTNKVPLLDLLYLPTTASQTNPEAVARFKVVFTPDGKVDITPWSKE